MPTSDSKINVLVVEDDELVLDLLRIELTREGFCVYTAKNASDTMNQIYNKKLDLDLCLADLKLPDGDGIGLLTQMKQVRSDLPIIIMTGSGSRAVFETALRSKSFDIIEKPFSIERDVMPVIRKAISSIILKKENHFLNEQILHNSKLAALGELAATIVHDIRGPITMIEMTCDDLKDEYREQHTNISEKSLFGYLHQVNKACDKIKKLVDHLRNYSRNDKDEKEEYRKVGTIIEESVFMVEQKIRKYGIHTRVNPSPDLVGAEMLCYPNKMEQVLMNLMSNACDAMSTTKNKELKVTLRSEDEFFYIDISDTGTGIPDDIKSKVFESFFTTKPKGQGTGLGLSIVKNIVKDHEGDLFLTSSVGMGTVFSVKIPLSRIRLPEAYNKVA